MKKLVSILLVLCTVVTLCLSFTSCDMETVSPYTQLRDHLATQNGETVMLLDEGSAMTVTLKREYLDGNADADLGEQITVAAEAKTGNTQSIRITFAMQDGSETYLLNYSFVNTTTGESMLSATAVVDAHDYTGNDLIPFTSVTNIHTSYEFGHRQNLTAILNSILLAMDEYLGTIDLSVTDFGFKSLSDKYRFAPQNAGVAEEDLGGIFSAERWAYSGEMLVLGIGMVFLVLAILWAVLAIFAKTMGGAEKPAKQEKPAPKSEPKPAPAPAAPVVAHQSDDAIVAAITAAIAMTIESDPALSAQFKSGFRVVSFKKKSGKTSWNH